MIIINDSNYKQEILALVTQIFEENQVQYDPLDYGITKVESTLDEWKSENLGNTTMFLAPILTNLELPNLELYYDRRPVEEVLTPLHPSIVMADNSMVASQVLDQIRASINNGAPITDTDFYDTYVVEGEEGAFIELFALPESFFYLDNVRVTVGFVPKELHLSFSIEVYDDNGNP